MTLKEYHDRLSSAMTAAVEKAEALERNGGSGMDVAKAGAKADAYSDALCWLEQCPGAAE